MKNIHKKIGNVSKMKGDVPFVIPPRRNDRRLASAASAVEHT